MLTNSNNSNITSKGKTNYITLKVAHDKTQHNQLNFDACMGILHWVLS